MRRIILTGLFSIIVCLVAGCAGHAPRPADAAGVSDAAEAIEKNERKDRPAPGGTLARAPGAKAAVKNEGGDYEIVRTPFGNIKRRRPATQPRPAAVNPPPPAREESALPMSPARRPPAPEIMRPPSRPAAAPSRSSGGESLPPGDIVLNFDNAELHEVIRTMAEMLGFNYIVDAGVNGKVTIHTAGKLRADQLFPVFYHILDVNGLTAIRTEDGNLFKIIKLKDAPRMSILSHTGRPADGVPALPPGDRVLMQIVPLSYISVQQMSKLLTPFISVNGTMVTHEGSNTLLVVDKATTISKVLRMVDAFDIDLFEKVYHRFYKIRFTDVTDMASLLNEVLAVYSGAQEPMVRLLPIERLNTLLVISHQPNGFGTIERLLEQLDAPSETDAKNIYVYSVRNGQAEELSTLLNEVFRTSKNKEDSDRKYENKEEAGKKIIGNPFAKKENRVPGESAPGQASLLSLGTGTLRGQVQIIADEVRNALVIEAYPSDYRIIETVLNRIDILPRQVLIEVIIAEVSLSEGSELGISWAYQKYDSAGIKLDGSGDASLLSGDIGASGLAYAVEIGDRLVHTLNTLATENKVNVLSSPTLLASDNKQATINISTEVPVASAEYQFDAGSEGVIQTNIQYRNTGVILSVTPHITERGLVNMEISQEVSEVSDGVSVGGKSYPSFRQRMVTTDLTVNDGQTIVLGGLMTETDNNDRNGVPGLHRIPLLGFLFGEKSKSVEKRELIILISPRVITNLEDVDDVTSAFKQKVGRVTERFLKN